MGKKVRKQAIGNVVAGIFYTHQSLKELTIETMNCDNIEKTGWEPVEVRYKQ